MFELWLGSYSEGVKKDFVVVGPVHHQPAAIGYEVEVFIGADGGGPPLGEMGGEFVSGQGKRGLPSALCLSRYDAEFGGIAEQRQNVSLKVKIAAERYFSEGEFSHRRDDRRAFDLLVNQADEGAMFLDGNHYFERFPRIALLARPSQLLCDPYGIAEGWMEMVTAALGGAASWRFPSR